VTSEEKTLAIGAAVLAVFAVAYLSYQHNQATASIIAAASSGSAGTPGKAAALGANVYEGGPIWNASLAGMVTPGQDNLVPVPAISPVQINPGYVAGPNGNGGAWGTGPSPFMYQ
jgi:hypothetical protein